MRALLELAETGPFAMRAFVCAAELIRTTPAPVAELVRAGLVRDLRAIQTPSVTRLAATED